MDVGAKLKEARLAKEISLDSLQEKTKIQKRYLVAIEEGNFDILPGKFYMRAFIKEYAQAVGLDPNDVLDDHQEEIPSTEEENVQYSRIQRTRKESKSEKESRTSSIIPTITVILLIIGIIVVAWFFIRESSSPNDSEPIEDNTDGNVIISDPDGDAAADGGDEEEKEKDSEEADGEEENQEADEPENEAVTVEVVEEGSGASSPSVLSIQNASDEVTLTLELTEADQNTWLDVTTESGETLYSSNFDASSSPLELDISGEESITLNIGNTPALAISVNGTDVASPNTSAVHQRIELQLSE